MLRRLLPSALLAVVSAYLVGWSARFARGSLTLGVAGLLLAAAAAFAVPHWVLLAAFAGAAFQGRVGGLGGAISYADVLMVIGTVVALRWAPRRRDQLATRVFWGYAAYAGLLLVAVVAAGTGKARIEWLHRLALVPGPVIVGIAIVRLDKVRFALRGFVVVIGLVSLMVVARSVATGFAPAGAVDLNKNAAGLLCAFALLVLFLAPAQLRWARSVLLAGRIVVAAGLLATQSRGSMVAFVAAYLTVAVLRMPGERRRHRLGVLGVVVGAVALVVVAYTVAERDLGGVDSSSAIVAREDTFAKAWDVVVDSPLVGAGPRYFDDAPELGGIPHNVVISELAEGGLVTLAGLTVLLVVTWRALRASRTDLATLGLAVFTAEIVASMFDIFWVAGRIGCAFVVVGMALTTPDPDRSVRVPVAGVGAGRRPAPGEAK